METVENSHPVEFPTRRGRFSGHVPKIFRGPNDRLG
jgi:hypothetical protein